MSGQATRAAATEELARLLAGNWPSARQLDALPDTLQPATLAEAYRVQERALAIDGAPTAGWKLAVTEAPAQQRNGIDGPITGRLLADGLLASPAAIAASAFPEGRAAMELEIGIRIGDPSGLQGSLGDIDAAIDRAVDRVFVCVELPALRFRDMRAAGALALAADNAAAFRAVLGAEVAVSHLSWLDGIDIRLDIGGGPAANGKVGDLSPGPAAAMRWLVAHLDRRGLQLHPGDVILTGAQTGLHLLAAGDRVVAEIAGLGCVEIDIG